MNNLATKIFLLFTLLTVFTYANEKDDYTQCMENLDACMVKCAEEDDSCMDACERQYPCVFDDIEETESN